MRMKLEPVPDRVGALEDAWAQAGSHAWVLCLHDFEVPLGRVCPASERDSGISRVIWSVWVWWIWTGGWSSSCTLCLGVLEPAPVWAICLSVDACNPEDHAEARDWEGDERTNWVVVWAWCTNTFVVTKFVLTSERVLASITSLGLQLVETEVSDRNVGVSVKDHPLRAACESDNNPGCVIIYNAFTGSGGELVAWTIQIDASPVSVDLI